jgi:hypothetical protein
VQISAAFHNRTHRNRRPLRNEVCAARGWRRHRFLMSATVGSQRAARIFRCAVFLIRRAAFVRAGLVPALILGHHQGPPLRIAAGAYMPLAGMCEQARTCWARSAAFPDPTHRSRRPSRRAGRGLRYPLAVPVDRSTKALLGGSIVALLVTKWGLAMSKDEEISGPGVRDFGLASPVKGLSNWVTLSPARGSLGG